MAVEIQIPRLGWSMEEGTFGGWLKKDGELVCAGDMLFVVEGEKATQEIESFDAGTLHIPPNAPRPGDAVQVGQPIGFLLAADESPPTLDPPPSVSSVKPAAPESVTRPTGSQPAPNAAIPTGRSRPIASPRARRRARELAVDWSKIRGTGRSGRIRERDVIAFATNSQQATTPPAPAAVGQHRPAAMIRRTIAQRMLAAVQQTAPVTLTTKVNATELVAFRDRLKAEYAGAVVPRYDDVMVKLVAAALSDCPALNACWRNDGVFYYDDIHVAIAVETDAGLVAPVIKNVVALSLEEVAEQSRALAEQARTGTLAENQLQGGTFTITNLGMFDVDFFTPILNLPQSGILGVGRIVREPVVRDDQVVPGDTLWLSLTFDHRVLDGAPAARWLQRLSAMIRQPAEFV